MIKINNKWKIIVTSVFVVLFLILTFANVSVFYEGKKLQLDYFITTVACMVLFFVLGVLKFNFSKKTTTICGIVANILAIVGAMHVSVLFSGGFAASSYMYFVNMAFYLCVAAVVIMITGRMRISVISALAASYLFNGISFIVYCFRGWSLTPTDLVAVGTAMNVANQYEFNMRFEIFASTAVMALVVMLVYKFPFEFTHRKKNRFTVRCAGLGVLLASLLFIGSVDYSDFNISVYDQHKANMNYGSAFSFYVNASKIGLKQSDNYNAEEVDNMLLSYNQTTEENTDMPNVLVVMNESFSDLSVVGDFKTNIDYMPFVRSLEENTIKGQTLVSPFGGYTCNSEYEFLTGMSTGLFETQQAPYMQMIFDYLPYSLPRHMEQLGYTPIGIHPYTGDGWNRNTVYPYMGFDDYISVEDFDEYNPEPEYLRKYITDRSNYDAVMKLLEDKDDNERAFIYNITMQNHGGYTSKKLESEVKLLNMNGKYPKVEQYLTVIRHADEDLKYLIERLSAFDEPTVLVVFGDHLPSVEPAFFEELYGASLDSLGPEELYKRYITPFFIWANFEIEAQQGVKTSPCFLSNMMMEVAGLPKSRVQLYLDDLQTEIAQINPICYFDNEGNIHMHEESDRIDEYYNLQYALLTGENISYDFYNFKDSLKLASEALIPTVNVKE